MLKNNEEYILSILLEKYYWTLEQSLKFKNITSKQIIDAFGNDIYNEEVLKKCNNYTKSIARKLSYS